MSPLHLPWVTNRGTSLFALVLLFWFLHGYMFASSWVLWQPCSVLGMHWHPTWDSLCSMVLTQYLPSSRERDKSIHTLDLCHPTQLLHAWAYVCINISGSATSSLPFTPKYPKTPQLQSLYRGIAAPLWDMWHAILVLYPCDPCVSCCLLVLFDPYTPVFIATTHSIWSFPKCLLGFLDGSYGVCSQWLPRCCPPVSKRTSRVALVHLQPFSSA